MIESKILQVTTHTTIGSVAVITATQTDQKESTERNGTENERETVNEESAERNTTAVAAANVKI